ncbi:MAG: hypothetical protein ACFFED_10580 [Candidatus Thorarchaeota archaeon]
MKPLDIDSALPSCFHTLVEAAFAITNGAKGSDYLVLNDGDEMKGYKETDYEKSFRTAVEEIEEYTSSFTNLLTSLPEVVRVILWSLVMASPAVDAYRARMYAYATDWGSEVSSVGTSSRRLQDVVDGIVKVMSLKEREKVYKRLPDEVRNKAIERIYWTSNDRHDSYYRSIKSILFSS